MLVAKALNSRSFRRLEQMRASNNPVVRDRAKAAVQAGHEVSRRRQLEYMNPEILRSERAHQVDFDRRMKESRRGIRRELGLPVSEKRVRKADDYNHRQLGRGKSRVTITHPRTGQKIPLKVRDYKHGAFTQGVERYNNASQGQRLGAALTSGRSDTAQRHGSAIGASVGASLPVRQRSSSHRHAQGWWKRTGVRDDATYRESDRLHIRRRTKREQRNSRIGQGAAGALIGGTAGIGAASLHAARHVGVPSGRGMAIFGGAGAALGAAAGAAIHPAHHQLEYRKPGGKKKVRKNDPWAASLEVPIVPTYGGRRANYRAGTATVGKRMSGAVTGVARPKRVRPGRSAARGVPGAGIPTKINFAAVGKADSDGPSRGKKLRRELVYDERFGLNPMNQQNKDWRKHWKTNAGHMAAGWGAGATVGAGIQHARGGGRSRLMGAAVGGLAGELAGAQIARHKIIRRMEDSGQLSKRDRKYNPEANRQRRLGYAAAGTGIAGAASTASGVRAIRNSDKTIDAGQQAFKLRAKTPGQKKEASDILRALAARKEHGIHFVSGRSAAKLGIGAGLLGASGGMAHYGRSRANREWR